MEQDNFTLANLKECHEKGDGNKILSCLLSLKKHLRGAKNVDEIDRETYEILINLIKYPNSKIMDVSMSILANCCLKNYYCELFRELGGIPHLILIIKTVDNDNILCRACRLLGNLAKNYSLASILNEYNAGIILLKSLETIDNKSAATLMMTFRAIKKLWAVKEYQSKMLSEDVCANITNCLHSTDEMLVNHSIETLTLFSTVKSFQNKNGLKISKELLARLVELSKKEETTDSAINCLSNLIYYQTAQVWKHLEGSRLAETFIDYIQEVDNINRVVLKAFQKLCTQGAVRNKVKSSGLFPKLMKLCCGNNGNNTRLILSTFYLFQYDISSIEILAQDKEFVRLLTRNITESGAIRLLSVVSRLDPPVKELLSEENLSIIIKNKECHGILKKIVQTKKFLRQLIVSGRVWEISQINCLFDDQDQYAEALLVHLLRAGDRDEMENAALAVPFLVKPRHFTLYNILAHNNGITIILRLLEEKTLEERVLATIVKLISIFQENFYHDYLNHSYKFSRGFFDGALLSKGAASDCRNEMQEDISMEDIDGETRPENKCDNSEVSNPEMVTFELDCGTCMTANKNLLCENSPVLDAMLNGHFIESNQKKVRLSCCSAEALQYLEQLLMNKGTINTSDLNIGTHLELISVTDRFLMSNLNDLLTATLPLNQSSCVAVLEWCRNSGYTKNNRIIKKKAYEFVFSSSSNLLLAMRNDALRTSLVNEISHYLSTSFIDLL